MERVGQHFSGGILGALKLLQDHWGAVGRDLAQAHWTWNDIGDGLPFDQFVQMVMYAPPGTAVFHAVNEGWTADTHKVTDLIEWVKLLVCANTQDPESAVRQLEKDPRPGVPKQEQSKVMTVGEYMKLAGLEG